MHLQSRLGLYLILQAAGEPGDGFHIRVCSLPHRALEIGVAAVLRPGDRRQITPVHRRFQHKGSAVIAALLRREWVLISLVVFSRSGGQSRGADLDASAAVAAHEAAIGAIQSFDLRWSGYTQKLTAAGDWTPEVKVSSGRWIKRDRQERCQCELVILKRFGDFLYDGSKNCLLEGWNPHDPPTLTPTAQQGVTSITTVGAQMDGPDARQDPARAFLLTLCLDAMSKDSKKADVRHALKDLVAQSPKTEIRIEDRPGGGRFVHLQVEHPGISADPPNGSYFLIVLDSNANYLARRIEEHCLEYPFFDSASKKVVPQEVVYEREVVTFRDFGDGAFFPMEVRERGIQKVTNKVIHKRRCVVTEIKINEPLPPDAFDFRFPDNAIVRSFSPGMDKVHADLWGPDNKPRRAIRGPEDLGLPTAMTVAPAATRIWWIIAANVVIGVLVVVLVYRRTVSRRK